MSIATQTFFNTPVNNRFLFDSSKVLPEADGTTLKVQPKNTLITEGFSSSAGMIFDPAFVEFTGTKLRQINQRPANMTFGDKFTYATEANIGDGVLTRVLSGSVLPVIDSGFLKFDGITADQCADWDANLNADSQQIFTIEVDIQTKYSGSPSQSQVFVAIAKAAGDVTNLAGISHITTGQLRASLRDENGVSKNIDFGAWSPAVDTNYKLRLECNFTAGVNKMFIDDVQFGSTDTSTFIRSSDIGLIRSGCAVTTGSGITGQFWLKTIKYFSSALGTVPEDIPNRDYLETSVEIPEFSHVGIGSIFSANTFVTSGVLGATTFTVQIGQSGNYLYWAGSAWSISNNTPAQSSDSSIMNTELPNLTFSGENHIRYKVQFADSNVQGEIENLESQITEGDAYPTDNPTIQLNTAVVQIVGDQLFDFIEDVEKSGLDNVRWALELDGVPKYYNVGAPGGGAWDTSNLDYATHTNSVLEILAGKDKFLQEGFGKTIGFYAFLHSEDGQTAPKLKSNTIEYDFFALPPTFSQAKVYSRSPQIDGSFWNGPICVELSAFYVAPGVAMPVTKIPVVINSNNYWEVTFRYSDSEAPTELTWYFGAEGDPNRKIIKTAFPAGAQAFDELAVLG